VKTTLLYKRLQIKTNAYSNYHDTKLGSNQKTLPYSVLNKFVFFLSEKFQIHYWALKNEAVQERNKSMAE